MEKSKLGISVGLFGALLFIIALSGGYIITTLIVGYVLLMETNEWLRKSAVKALVALAFFSALQIVVGLIPDILNFLTSILNTFGASLYFSFINSVFNCIATFISLVKTVVFVLLAIKALNQGTIKIPVVDDLINKYV